MGIAVMIMGESGSGKSTSLRNFAPDKVGIFNVASKPLPFRKRMRVCNTSDYRKIKNGMANSACKTFVIDDSQALMAFSLFSKAKETGYNKFTELAVNFADLIKFVNEQLPPDCIVYFLHHTEQLENGRIKAKTVGKMLDNQLTVESLFSIVLLCKTEEHKYWLETQSDGYTTAKSPMEMFPLRIDNDLAEVDRTIREYWGLEPIEDDNANHTDSNDNTGNPANTENSNNANSANNQLED